jgi:hypothetical protein
MSCRHHGGWQVAQNRELTGEFFFHSNICSTMLLVQRWRTLGERDERTPAWLHTLNR